MIGSISGQIKAKAARFDPSSYGRSDTSSVGRWFWEIDKVLLLLIATLIGIGLIAVAAASPAAGQRYSGGSVRFSELHYFYRQIVWIGVGLPVMIAISMMPRERAKRFSLAGAAFFLVLLAFVPILGPEVNGATRWIDIGIGQLQPSEFLKPFFVVAMAWLLSLREQDKTLPVFWLSAALLLLVGMSMITQAASTNTLIQSMVPDSLRGRVMAVYAMMLMGMSPMGALIGGALADRIGAPYTVVIGGSICVAGAIVFNMRLPALRVLARQLIDAQRPATTEAPVT